VRLHAFGDSVRPPLDDSSALCCALCTCVGEDGLESDIWLESEDTLAVRNTLFSAPCSHVALALSGLRDIAVTRNGTFVTRRPF
jgi:hypothetical protein